MVPKVSGSRVKKNWLEGFYGIDDEDVFWLLDDNEA